MTLHYSFDGISCLVEDTRYTHRWEEPHYYRQVCDGVEFDYEVDISYEDVFDYLLPYGWNSWTDEQKEAYKRGFDALWNKDLINLDELEDDNDFITFMEERYDDDARNACEEENSI